MTHWTSNGEPLTQAAHAWMDMTLDPSSKNHAFNTEFLSTACRTRRVSADDAVAAGRELSSQMRAGDEWIAAIVAGTLAHIDAGLPIGESFATSVKV